MHTSSFIIACLAALAAAQTTTTSTTAHTSTVSATTVKTTSVTVRSLFLTWWPKVLKAFRAAQQFTFQRPLGLAPPLPVLPLPLQRPAQPPLSHPPPKPVALPQPPRVAPLPRPAIQHNSLEAPLLAHTDSPCSLSPVFVGFWPFSCKNRCREPNDAEIEPGRRSRGYQEIRGEMHGRPFASRQVALLFCSSSLWEIMCGIVKGFWK
jgi:hypothetical protein